MNPAKHRPLPTPLAMFWWLHLSLGGCYITPMTWQCHINMTASASRFDCLSSFPRTSLNLLYHTSERQATLEKLRAIKSPRIRQVRGLGLMVGVKLKEKV